MRLHSPNSTRAAARVAARATLPRLQDEAAAKAAAAEVGAGVGVGDVGAVVAGAAEAVVGAVTAGSLGFEPVTTFAVRSVLLWFFFGEPSHS
jgi:pantoate kinase